MTDSYPRAEDLTARQRETTPHEPGEPCHPVHGPAIHCYVHNVDEVMPEGEAGYLACGECFHLYRTAGELRRAYRWEHWQMVKTSWELRRIDLRANWWELGGSPYGTPLREFLWWVRRALFVRASKIYYCQYCSHDF